MQTNEEVKAAADAKTEAEVEHRPAVQNTAPPYEHCPTVGTRPNRTNTAPLYEHGRGRANTTLLCVRRGLQTAPNVELPASENPSLRIDVLSGKYS